MHGQDVVEGEAVGFDLIGCAVPEKQGRGTPRQQRTSLAQHTHALGCDDHFEVRRAGAIAAVNSAVDDLPSKLSDDDGVFRVRLAVPPPLPRGRGGDKQRPGRRHTTARIFADSREGRARC